MRNLGQIVLIALMVLAASSMSLAQTSTDVVSAAGQSKAAGESLLQSQETELQAATAKLAELQQLVNEGLVARVELETAEQSLSLLKASVEATRKRIADSDKLIADLRAAETAAATKFPLVAKTNSNALVRPTILRYNGLSSWSLGNLSNVQSFFAATFGQALPTSAVGQSSTHNRLGYDHRNAVDVALHPDSAQGKALIGYLQSQGIPFLAFRAAVPGVATGPHIHIGSPSHRLS
jgi:hypothetical protein